MNPMSSPVCFRRKSRTIIGACLFALTSAAGFQVRAQVRQIAYADALQNGWQDYGWAKLNYANATPVHSGTSSISVTAAAYTALYLHHDGFASGTWTNLSFWIHGGTAGGQLLQVQATVNGAAQPARPLAALTSQWQQISLSLASLGITNQSGWDGFWIQDRSGKSQTTFYVDDIVLTGPPAGPLPPAVLAVNAARNRHPIAPEVYGLAFPGRDQLSAARSPLSRSGGNAETRYNWQLNAHNRGADFYFESLSDGSALPGQATDAFIASTRESGAAPMVTVPMIGWAAKLGPNRGKLASFSIKKYGPQTGNDAAYFADAGNGIKSDGPPVQYVINNDPNDANLPADSSFWGGWVDHLIQKWGTSAVGGLRYYLLDNEPSLWHSSHRDVHPVGAKLEEIRDRTLEYATMIKSRDPGAVLFAPEEWGWSGYLYSGYDQQYGAAHNYSSYPDRAAHGNQEAIPWLLDQWREADAKSGRRSIDVLSVHFYPQGGEFSDDVSASMQRRRNRSTRALWDPQYVDETWINTQVRLIPRLKEWVAAHYPGTRIALTEYNWGAEKHISGAIAQADILGILGREGIEFATRWTTPASDTPAFNAFRLFRNYDGQGSAFGDVSVEATAADPDTATVFAAQRSSDQALTVIALNKEPGTDRTVRLTIAGQEISGSAEVWRLDAANRITRLANAALTNSVWEGMLPGQSITLFVLPPRTLNLKVRAGISPISTLLLQATGRTGDTVQLDSSEDLHTWVPLRTSTLAGESVEWTLPVPEVPFRYYRATSQP